VGAVFVLEMVLFGLLNRSDSLSMCLDPLHRHQALEGILPSVGPSASPCDNGPMGTMIGL
jgi:hypothetical protein